MNTEIKIKDNRKKNYSKFVHTARKFIMILTAVTVFLALSAVTVFAAGETDNSAPAGVQTTTMSSLSNIIWWIVRVAILAGGGIPAGLKIVQGQSNEDPRDRNSGITTAIVTAAVFGATFAIQALIGI